MKIAIGVEIANQGRGFWQASLSALMQFSQDARFLPAVLVRPRAGRPSLRARRQSYSSLRSLRAWACSPRLRYPGRKVTKPSLRASRNASRKATVRLLVTLPSWLPIEPLAGRKFAGDDRFLKLLDQKFGERLETLFGRLGARVRGSLTVLFPVVLRRLRRRLAPKQLHEGILDFLYLAFHRKQVDAVDPSEKDLLADFELGVRPRPEP